MLDISDKNRIFRVIFLMIILSWTSIKIILPALPVLHTEFGVEMKDIKLTVTVFLLVMSLAQLIWGALAGFFTAKFLILLGLCITLVGSLVSMTAVSFEMYFAGRALEGLGLGCLSPIARAILANIFDRKEFASKAAVLAIVTAMLPAISSLAGGHIMAWMGWRSIFGFLALLNLLVIFLAYRYVNNIPAPEKTSGNPALVSVFKSYISVLKSRYFWGYITPYAFILGSLIGYYSASPFWFVNDFGFSGKHFSNFLLPTALFIIFGLIVGKKLISKYAMNKVILWGLMAALFAFILTILFWFISLDGIWVIIAIFSILGFANGMISPGTNAECLTRLKTYAAPASALITCYVFLMSSIFSGITMKMNVADFYTMVILIGGITLISFLVYWFGIYKSEVKQ